MFSYKICLDVSFNSFNTIYLKKSFNNALLSTPLYYYYRKCCTNVHRNIL